MLREALDIFLEQNPDLTEEEVANPERMVCGIQIFNVKIFTLSLLNHFSFSETQKETKTMTLEIAMAMTAKTITLSMKIRQQ